jgi:hypothetical protein
MQLLKRAAQAMELIDKMENDVDTLVIDSEVAFQITDQMCPSHIRIGEHHFGGRLIWNEPPLFNPELQRLYLQTRTGQELPLVHDMPSSRGLDTFPLSHFETNASSSGSGPLGKTTFNLTN